MGWMMADSVEFEFPDLPDLIDRMNGLNDRVQRSIARRATAKGARLIRDKIRDNAARMDDLKTKESIVKNVHAHFASRLSKREGGVAFRVGIRGGAKSKAQNETNRGGDTFYWRFLEFGTHKMPAKPFFRPAIEQSKNAAINAVVKEALRLIEVESKKGR